MSETTNCTHECGSCKDKCASETKGAKPFLQEAHEMSTIKKVIGVVSGKGGVGKSLITSLLATGMNERGYKTAILDGDITGPSIPKVFGIKEKAMANQYGMIPVRTQKDIQVMSINLLLEHEEDPVVWRGPVIASTVKQFWSEVIWENVDYMFVDMPPGTGDVPLTVFQSIPLEGIIIVTSPQDLVSMIVGKAVKMANAMDVPIIGIVENYSYLNCPDCGKKINVFGESKIEKVADEFGIEVLTKLPIDPEIAKACDSGQIESITCDAILPLLDTIEKLA